MVKYTLFLALSLASFGTLFSQERPSTIDDIFAPTIVGVPPSDAYIGLSKMEDGEIRHYNYGEQESSHPYYLSSRDSGLTWSEVSISKVLPYADNRSPISGEYMRAVTDGKKVYLIRTVGGIDGGRTIMQIDSTVAIMLKPPVFFNGGKSVVIAGHGVDRTGCFTYVSNDDGLSWQKSNKINSPFHEKGGEHKGIRWNHGAVEPTIAELSDGRLWMLIRTSRDRHYQSFSSDGALSWSEPEPSSFYGTITMPTFHKMEDGRLLLFWSNTTPLPEMETATGVWDDVFTNRSASHVAISEDGGESWIGMRELILDTRRNASDFGETKGIDKSVHQAQAVELDGGKVLVSVGQNILHRKLMIFDTRWLYERSRECDFSNGLDDWSAFRYYKGIVGHCGYNRQAPDLLAHHPDRVGAKVLKIGYTPNSELVEDRDGAVWNFPASKSGVISVRAKLLKDSKPISLIVNDRWFNPTDTIALVRGLYSATLDRAALKIKDDKWHDISIEWSDGEAAKLLVDGKVRAKLPLINSSLHGASYLHLLSGDEPDQVGVLIESVKAESR